MVKIFRFKQQEAAAITVSLCWHLCSFFEGKFILSFVLMFASFKNSEIRVGTHLKLLKLFTKGLCPLPPLGANSLTLFALSVSVSLSISHFV